MYDRNLPPAPAETLVGCVRHWAVQRPNHPVYGFARFSGVGPDLTTMDFATLDRHARAFAVGARQLAEPGDRVALLVEPGMDYVVSFLGCLYAELVAVPLYPPDPARVAERIDAALTDADAAFVVTTAATLADVKEWLNAADPIITRTVFDMAEIELDYADEWVEPVIDPDSIAFLQYSSGSTRTPTGVMVRHRNLVINARQIAGQLELGRDTVLGSWLPLFHDMGLMFGVAIPAVLGARVAQLNPLAFLQQPARWLQLISELRVTAAAAPDFAYALCVERVRPEHCVGLDLSRWTAAVSGAEPVRASTLRAFTDAFSPYGFAETTFVPGYGLAEATLAVTGPALGSGPVVLTVDRDALADRRVVLCEPNPANSVEVVSCGSASPDTTVVIVDPKTGELAPDAGVGEVWISGPSVAAGYWRRADSDAIFRAHLGAGELEYLRSGDLGFLRDGDLFVIGRLKDLVIIDGRNHYPPDVEQTVENSHPVIRTSRCAAFSVEDGGNERLVVVAEVDLRSASPDSGQTLQEAANAARRAIATRHEVGLHAFIAVKRGQIPLTSSGKVRRNECRKAYLAGALSVIAPFPGAGVRHG